jgi:hypothetical protein
MASRSPASPSITSRSTGRRPRCTARAAAAAATPDRLTATTGAIASERLAWFDVALTTPGRYAGQLAVGDARFPVELTIEPTARLDVAAAPRVWAYYEPAELGANVDLDTEWRYAELMRGYGVMATPELTQDNWTARQRWVAGARYVPVWLSREPAEVGAEVAAWIARTAGTGVVPFAIPVDEPRTDEKRAKVRALSAAARAAGAGAGAGRFLYAVTHAPDPRLGDAIDVYIAPGAARDRTLARDRAWTYNGSPGWAGAMVVDDAGGGPRTWGWLAFAYDVPLWYVWDALYWRDRYRRGDDAPPLDLLRDPITFDDGEDRGAPRRRAGLPWPPSVDPPGRAAPRPARSRAPRGPDRVRRPGRRRRHRRRGRARHRRAALAAHRRRVGGPARSHPRRPRHLPRPGPHPTRVNRAAAARPKLAPCFRARALAPCPAPSAR